MNRRNFLKLIATVPAIAAVPSLALVSESTPAQKNQQTLGLVRENFAYDIYTDRTLVRHDVSNGRVQFGVMQPIYGEVVTEDQKKESRSVAVKLLVDEMKKRGISVNDLIQLPAMA
jgi:hypothetical protein